MRTKKKEDIMADMIRCPACNAETSASNKFCEFCGSPLNAAPVNPTAPANGKKIEEYKCPACGSPLVFSTDSGKLKCSACDNEYEVGTIQQYQEKRASLNADIDRILKEITSILGIDDLED